MRHRLNSCQLASDSKCATQALAALLKQSVGIAPARIPTAPKQHRAFVKMLPTPVFGLLALVLSASAGAEAAVDCSTCVAIATVAEVVAENATTMKDVVEILDGLCDILYQNNTVNHTLCDDLVTTVDEVLPWLDKQILTLAWDPLAFCSVVVPACTQDCCVDSTPEQLRLALTGDPMEMSITWVTLNATAQPVVQYGVGTASTAVLNNTALATSARTYTQGGWRGVILSATMVVYLPGTAYTYRVGDAATGIFSQNYTFYTLPAEVGTIMGPPLRIVQIGDMAYDNNSDVTVAAITSMALAHEIDFVLHVGDISYADGYMHHWDLFGRKVQDITARIPYMVNPGNHGG